MSMNNASLRAAQGYPGFARIIGRALSLLGLAMERTRPPAGDLSRLDDHLLRDIGLTRADVQDLADETNRVPDIETRRLCR